MRRKVLLPDAFWRRLRHQRMHAILQQQLTRPATFGPAPARHRVQVPRQCHVGFQIGARQIALTQKRALPEHDARRPEVMRDIPGSEPVGILPAARDHAQRERPVEAHVQARGGRARRHERFGQRPAILAEQANGGKQRAQRADGCGPALDLLVIADLQRHQRRKRCQRQHPTQWQCHQRGDRHQQQHR
jgi:hypothetical protein